MLGRRQDYRWIQSNLNLKSGGVVMLEGQRHLTTHSTGARDSYAFIVVLSGLLECHSRGPGSYGREAQTGAWPAGTSGMTYYKKAGAAVRPNTLGREVADMNAQADRRQAGVVLIEVVALLTLFGVVGVVFVFYSTAERQCEQNPTVEVRDGRCTKEVGTTKGRP